MQKKKPKKKKNGGLPTSAIKRVESYPDFETLTHAIQHGLQGLLFKNIEGDSKEANDLNHIL